MKEENPYKMSQEYYVLPPKPGRAYPILFEDWNYLKSKIQKLSYKFNFYIFFSPLLLGSSITTLLTILSGTVQKVSSNISIMWTTFFVTLVAGLLCLFFGIQKDKSKKEFAKDIITQMDVIEKRFDND